MSSTAKRQPPASFDSSLRLEGKYILESEEALKAMHISDKVRFPEAQISSSSSNVSTAISTQPSTKNSSTNNSTSDLLEAMERDEYEEDAMMIMKKKPAAQPSSLTTTTSALNHFLTNDDLMLDQIITTNTMEEEEDIFLRSFIESLPTGSVYVKLKDFFTAKVENGKPYTVFKITVYTLTEQWIVWRRYSDFVRIAQELQLKTMMPPKTPFGGNFENDFLLRREALLDQWVQNVIKNENTNQLEAFRLFLTKDANCNPPGYESSIAAAPTSSSSSFETNNNLDHHLQQFHKKEKLASSLFSTPLFVSRGSATPGATPSSTGILESPEQNNSNSVRKIPIEGSSRKYGLDDFNLIRVLGKGSFGKVVLASKKNDPTKLFAIKMLHKQNVVKKKQVEHTLTERSVLGKMNHPFIVKLYYAFQTETKLHFVLDFCAGGELFFHLGREGKFSEPASRFYAAEIALALGHLHAHGIVYRDLKPENVLLDASGNLKLADFGLSKEIVNEKLSHSFCGTPEYLAPEILDRTGHGMAVDWWSLGALLFEFLTGLPPWYSQDRQKMFASIRSAPLKFPADLSDVAKLVLTDFLRRAPHERLGANGMAAVKRHPFFAPIDWNDLFLLKVPPPFVPNLSSPTDTSNFDPTFTRLPLNSEDLLTNDQQSSVFIHEKTINNSGKTTNSALEQQQQGGLLFSSSNLSLSQQQQQQQQQQQTSFGGFTYNDKGLTTPTPTPPLMAWTPNNQTFFPKLPQQKRQSPNKPPVSSSFFARRSSSSPQNSFGT